MGIPKNIQAKIAITLNRLLVLSQKLSPEEREKKQIASSYNKIAIQADIRKATVSDTFNAKSVPELSTLIAIIEAMGFTLTDFSKIYDTITENEIRVFLSTSE